MLLQVLSCELCEGAGRFGWSLTPGSRWLRLHRRIRRHFSARTAQPYPLWAVHFSDRLAFGPVGFFCDRSILGPVPSSKTASQFYRVLNGPVLSLEPQQRRPRCRMKLRFARGATPSNAWPITGPAPFWCWRAASSRHHGCPINTVKARMFHARSKPRGWCRSLPHPEQEPWQRKNKPHLPPGFYC